MAIFCDLKPKIRVEDFTSSITFVITFSQKTSGVTWALPVSVGQFQCRQVDSRNLKVPSVENPLSVAASSQASLFYIKIRHKTCFSPPPPLPLGSFILCAVTPLAKRKKTNCYRRLFGTSSRKNETVKFLLGTSSAPRGLTTTRIVVTSVCEGRRSLLRDGSNDNNKVAHPHSGFSF